MDNISDSDLELLIEETFNENNRSNNENITNNVQSTTLAIEEQENYGNADYESKLLKNQRYKDDTAHRKVLSTWAGTLVSFWLVCVLLILTSNTNKFKLSDSVLIALLGTTTLNVLGLMVIVLNDLFNKSK